MNHYPHTTVATVVPQQGRFLMVQEKSGAVARVVIMDPKAWRHFRKNKQVVGQLVEPLGFFQQVGERFTIVVSRAIPTNGHFKRILNGR